MRSKRSRKIDRGSRFADAAFLIRDGDYFSHVKKILARIQLFHVEQLDICSTWNKAKIRLRPQGNFIMLALLVLALASLRRIATFLAKLRDRISLGATARETCQSNFSATSSARDERTFTFGRFREASRRKTALRRWDSIRVTLHSGRAIASGIPGNPAPEPMSTTDNGPGGESLLGTTIRSNVGRLRPLTY